MKKAILFSLFLTLAVAAFAQYNGCDPRNGANNASNTTTYYTPSHIASKTVDADYIVYPNPTKDAFALDAKSFDLGTAVKINLYNVMGQRVRTFTVGKEVTYQVGDLNDGMYFVQFLDAKGKTLATRKLNKANAITRS